MRQIIGVCMLVFCFKTASGQGGQLSSKISALPGWYRHDPPCGDCTGVQTTLTLQSDGTCACGLYRLKDETINTINGDKAAESSGKWKVTDTTLSDSGTTLIIALDGTAGKGKGSQFYMLIGSNLEQLDHSKQRIDPPFNLLLRKLDDQEIMDLR